MHRLIALEGATNVRDLGGYETACGRRVRWRRLFRADGLHGLTPADHGALEALGIEEALDLRYGPERAGEPPCLPDSVASVHVGLPDKPAASLLETLDVGGVPSADAARAWLAESYAGYPEKYAPACRAILRRLAAEGAPPLLFHCTAGKDRTGFAAAVVLEALGVPRARPSWKTTCSPIATGTEADASPRACPAKSMNRCSRRGRNIWPHHGRRSTESHGGLEGWLGRCSGLRCGGPGTAQKRRCWSRECDHIENILDLSHF